MSEPPLTRFLDKVQIVEVVPDLGPCWLWQASRDRHQYGYFGDGAKVVKAHRFSYATWVGEIPAGEYVLHRCDNPSCCCPEHLYSGTQKDNVNDMILRQRGNHAKGESNGNAKLCGRDVDEIRRLHSLGGFTPGSLARRFGISRSACRSVVLRETWKHR